MTNWPLMTEAELHALGIDLVVPMLANENVTVESVDRNPSRLVQVTGWRWGLPTVIAIRTACHPRVGELAQDEFFRLLDFANERGALPCLARVGLACVAYPDKSEVLDEPGWGKPIRNGGYCVKYTGLVIAAVATRPR